jgi:hypothetical protein
MQEHKAESVGEKPDCNTVYGQIANCPGDLVWLFEQSN